MKINWFKRKNFSLLALCLTSATVGVSLAQDDDTVESLYMEAGTLAMDGESAEASKKYEEMFELAGGWETLFEDYGAQAGGFFFDYGMSLLPQQRWEEAKEAFSRSVNAKAEAERVESPIPGDNPRENLAKFQLGFVEAQLGNNEEALRLYDEYLASSPPAEEIRQVQGSFKLRYGSALMKVGRTAEGVATIQELFDNRDKWNVSAAFLMQGMFELGTTLAVKAREPGTDDVEFEKISDQLHGFLDKNGGQVDLSPLDKFRFGFVDRLRTLGFESTKSGLYSVALRYFAYLPTLDDVKTDIQLSLARQPIGTGVPSQYQQILDRIAEREKVPLHPDAETLRLVATCYERMGNLHGPRSIYRHLAEHFPDVDKNVRGEILHEAARLSSRVGDHSAAQYFGDKFMAETGEDSSLRNNVSTFMLQSLFTAGEYERVIGIAERVRDKYEIGDPQRELADSLYPLAFYTEKRHEEAAEPFEEYVRGYPAGANREIVMFHRASNSLVLGKTREAAEYFEDFLSAFPESERFLDNALADLAIARFNLEDYQAAIEAADRLAAERPESPELGRVLTIKGDSYAIQAGDLGREEEEQKAEKRQAALEAYLAAVDAGQASEASDPDRADFHRETVSEGLWKSAEIYYDDGEIEKGIAQYDAFFPDYAGTYYEPQISIFSLEHLEEAGRGEEGLQQVEKMIVFLGNLPPERQDITLLRQAIGSYSEASVRIRGVEETLAKLDDFPGMDPENQALQTWLMIQKVVVLQGTRKGVDRDSAEYAAIEARIDEVFEELRLFEKRNLSEFALQQIGIHFSGTDNPFLAVPYFEELLARTNPDADAFKAPAEMQLGLIEMRSPNPGDVQSARERFRRIIDKYKDRALTPEAYLNLARLHIANEEWKDARDALQAINREKSYFAKDRAKRAEAGFLLGTVLDELDDPVGANKAYLSVLSTAGAYPDWAVQAWERYIPNSLADFEKMDTDTPEDLARKRQRELALYRLTRKYLFQWQNLTDEDVPSGALRRLRRDIVEMRSDLNITPEEEAQILRALGISEVE
ncbi:MAG: tetratricopeptide repeat protein [Verrucomicrobiales bacterium]